MNKELQELIREKELINATKSFPDKQKAYNVIQEFVKHRDVILYGGIALNALLPTKLKFYGHKDFPDFDCLSNNAKQTAKSLANVLVKQGFQYTEVRNAIHTNTFKVFVNFEAVADFTQVSKTFYAGVAKLATKAEGYTIAPPFLLKHYVLKELARPDGSAYRWQKVYKRSLLLDVYIDKFLHQSKAITSKHVTYDEDELMVLNHVMGFLKEHKYPLVGNLGMAFLLDPESAVKYECCKTDAFFSTFEILSIDPEQTLEKLKKILPTDVTINVSKRFYYQEIIPKRIRVYIKTKTGKELKLITIIHTDNNCFSYVDMDTYGVRVGSPYTILHLLYSYWIVYFVYESKRIQDQVLNMIIMLETYIKKLPIKQRFLLSCYGQEKTLMDVKKERWCDASKADFVYRPGKT